MEYTDSAQKSAEWITRNLEQVKLVNQSDDIGEMIKKRQERNQRMNFSVGLENFTSAEDNT